MISLFFQLRRDLWYLELFFKMPEYLFKVTWKHYIASQEKYNLLLYCNCSFINILSGFVSLLLHTCFVASASFTLRSIVTTSKFNTRINRSLLTLKHLLKIFLLFDIFDIWSDIYLFHLTSNTVREKKSINKFKKK